MTSALKSLTDTRIQDEEEEKGSSVYVFCETGIASQHFIAASKQISRFVKHNYPNRTQSQFKSNYSWLATPIGMQMTIPSVPYNTFLPTRRKC